MRYFGCGRRRAVLLLCQHATMYSTDYQTPHLPLPNSFHAPTKHIPPDFTVPNKKVTHRASYFIELGNVVLNQRKAHRNIGSSCNKKNKWVGWGGGWRGGSRYRCLLVFLSRFSAYIFPSQPSLLVADGCHLDGMHADTNAHTHAQKYTQLFIRSAAIGLRSCESQNMIS